MQTPSSMKWRATDLINFEYLLRSRQNGSFADSSADTAQAPDRTEDPQQRDRAIYRAYAAGHPEPVRRGQLFRYWLSEKRRQLAARADEAPVLPGTAAAEGLRLMQLLAILAGLLLGGGICGSLIAYAGDAPINVFTCLWVMLVPQLLLLVLLGLSAILGRFRRAPRLIGLYPMLAGIIQRNLKRLLKSRYAALPAAKREAMAAAVGLVGQSRSIYGRILFRPVFAIGQIFGICFNIGLAGVLLLRVAITDLAFGWQSTLQPAAETVHAIVNVIALPWSWLLSSSAAHPSVSEIRGSQFVFKEGMQHLDSPDMAAWWPFLLLCLLVYGLLPRLLLLLGTILLQKRALSRLAFTHAACDRLLLAMKTPRVESQSRQPEAQAAPAERAAAAGQNTASRETRQGATAEAGPVKKEAMEGREQAIVLIPEEIETFCNEETIASRLQQRLGLAPAACISCQMDIETDSDALKAHAPAFDSAGASGCRLVLIQEAWQPPIRETLSWITALRKSLPGPCGFIIGLIGKPRAGEIWTRPSKTDQQTWTRAAAKLGDPYIRVEVLGG
ncbi:MAG: DUF2868 domain-containing protein [Thermodesulfobacteriota bacterium]